MINSGITILGLGPGDVSLLTLEAWRIIESIPEIYLRTRQHPAVIGFPGRLRVYSFDHLYEKGESFETIYAEIVEQVVELGRRPQGVVYAVPGHPLVAEATSPEIARRARLESLPIQVVGGMSFLEPVLNALDLDVFPHSALVDALELDSRHVPPFPPSAPAFIAQIHSRAVASNIKLTLMEVYPDGHPVHLVHAAGTPQVKVESLPLYEIDRSPHIGLMTTLYLPPLEPTSSFEAFQEVIARLRAPDGCPWDREQTHQSLRSYLLEEVYEVLAALDADDPQSMREELGDLLLQIVLHAQIASENGEFRMADILTSIHDKIVRRHPHVFGDLYLDGADSVLQNWERLKAEERLANGQADKGSLDGVPLALPALSQAQEYQKRAARVKFDWPDIQGVYDKILEEIEEVQGAGSEKRPPEVGDLLFAVVNLARWCNVDAESVLREASARFRVRFNYMEKLAHAEGRELATLSLEEMESYWQEAKKAES